MLVDEIPVKILSAEMDGGSEPGFIELLNNKGVERRPTQQNGEEKAGGLILARELSQRWVWMRKRDLRLGRLSKTLHWVRMCTLKRTPRVGEWGGLSIKGCERL